MKFVGDNVTTNRLKYYILAVLEFTNFTAQTADGIMDT